jgi:hypothetical protein
MQLSLSPEEFRRLLLLATLGEVVMNDWTPQKELTGEQQACIDVVQDLYARAVTDRQTAVAVEDPQSGCLLPGPEMRAQIDKWLSAYDNDVFWDELVMRLAQRDMAAEYGRETLEAMPEAYRRSAEQPILDYYWREVRQNGMDHIVMQEEAPMRQPRRRSGRGRTSILTPDGTEEETKE